MMTPAAPVVIIGFGCSPHAAEDYEDETLPRRERPVEVALHREAEAEAGRDAGHYSVNVAYQVALQQDARVVAEGEGRHEGEEAEAACREASAVRVRACDRGGGVCRERNGRRDVGNNRVVEDEEVRREWFEAELRQHRHAERRGEDVGSGRRQPHSEDERNYHDESKREERDAMREREHYSDELDSDAGHETEARTMPP